MCGIVGYIGERKALPILIKGLKRLEYRGYDSSGIAVLDNVKLGIFKKKGKVSELESYIGTEPIDSTIGIAHTRWATHGEPNDVNAHPHTDEEHNFAVVHNGIIENYSSLKQKLIKQGHLFASDTDTEVLVHLIEDFYAESNSFEDAVQETLKIVEGTYGILVLSKAHPDTIIASRKGSPLVIGVGEGEYFIASDAVPIVEYTRSVVYLNDYDIAIIKKGQLTLKTLQDEIKKAVVRTVEFNAEELEKSGFEHFMLKEIFEQPKALENSMRGRVKLETNSVVLGGLLDVQDQILFAPRIIIIACGTSWHSALVGKFLLEKLTRIPVEVEYASEFRYRDPIINKNDVVLAISQSGETADTLEALRLAKSHGALTLGVCNVIGSSIARETDAGVYSHAGPEIGVASTKAFSTQVLILTMMALWIAGRKKTVEAEELHKIIEDLYKIPETVDRVLQSDQHIRSLAAKFKDAKDFLFMGRGVEYPIALEGALKLKEISYIHAEGYPAGEMKHGPIALIDEYLPSVFVCPQDLWRDKTFSNMQEVKARKGIVIAVATEGDEDVKTHADYVLEVPKVQDLLYPLITAVPLQLLAYHIAVLRGCNVDQPRNLAKSVTVE